MTSAVSPIITPDAIKRLLMQGGDPSAMFNGDPSQQPPSGPAPVPADPNKPPMATAGLYPPSPAASAPPSGSISGAATSSAPPSGSVAQSMPSFSSPEEKQQWLSENPVAMPPRPVGFSPKQSILASLFAGLAEYGGEKNRHPGLGAPIVQRLVDQNMAQRQYDANAPYMKQQAENQAYNQYLEQQKGSTDVAKTQAEIPNIRANVPALQRQQEFLDKVRQLKEAGKYPSDQDLFNSVLPEAATVPGMTRQMIVDQINGSKTLGSKYTLTRDPQTQAPIELVDRQGNHYSASNLPKDPEAQQMWNDAQTASGQKEKVEEDKEKRVAGYAADRQAQAFTNQQTEQGKKAASTSLADINDAKNQQSMIEQLLSGKMNPQSQTAAMFKLIGAEQPTGSHRIMPTEIENEANLGGWSDRLKQKVLNWKEGDRFSPDLIPDIISTAKILTQNKAKTANDNLESTARIYGYKAPGSDARGRFDKPEDYAQPQQGSQQKTPPKGATHTGIGSQDKKKHWLDAQGNDLGVAE
jgi:hypothetical protein